MTTRRDADSAAGGLRSAHHDARCDALIAGARTLARTGAAQRALPLAAVALALAQRGVDDRREAHATEALADSHYGLSTYPEALAHYLSAFARWRRQRDCAGQVRCLAAAHATAAQTLAAADAPPYEAKRAGRNGGR